MARVPYVEGTDLPDEHQHLIESSLQGRPLNVYAAFGNNPAVLVGLRRFFRALWRDTGLSTRQRELVILTVARDIENEYEWHQHARIAPDEGVDRSELLAIADGDFQTFDPGDALLLKYVDAVLEHAVTDDLHERIAAEYDDATVVGIAALAAGYRLLGMLIEALAIDLDEPFVGWELDRDCP